MRSVLLFICLALAVSASLRSSRVRSKPSIKEKIDMALSKWNDFKEKFDKSYDEEEEIGYMEAFVKNLIKIEEHNERYKMGKASFEMGLNHISDLPYHQYQKLNGFRRPYGDSYRKNASTFLVPFNTDVPENVDWRDHGLVTDVKNQGMCGSCWAFSSTGALEGQHMRKLGKMISLSEQNLVDCSSAYGNHGCEGGFMDYAFNYIKENHGIDTEDSYPYMGHDGRCHFKKQDVGAEDNGFVDLPANDEEKLKIAVATQGPISVAIDAGHRSFQMYKKGVYYEKECSSTQLNHGVLLVGYGTDPEDGDYWLVKNSWGTGWGDKGYVKMARNRDNHCGIASAASYPIV